MDRNEIYRRANLQTQNIYQQKPAFNWLGLSLDLTIRYAISITQTILLLIIALKI